MTPTNMTIGRSVLLASHSKSLNKKSPLAQLGQFKNTGDQVQFSGKASKAKKAGWAVGLGGLLLIASGNASKIPFAESVPGYDKIENVDLFDFPDFGFGDKEEYQPVVDPDQVETDTPVEEPQEEAPEPVTDEIVIPENPTPIQQETPSVEAQAQVEASQLNIEEIKAALYDSFNFVYLTAPEGGGTFVEAPITAEAEALKEPVIDRIAYLIQNRPDIVQSIQNQVSSSGETIPIQLYNSSSFTFDNGSSAAGQYLCSWSSLSGSNSSFRLTTENIISSYNALNNGSSYDVITHEFMHFIDALDNSNEIACKIDGLPPNLTEEERSAFIEAREIEKERIRNGESIMWEYALEDNHEFVAVLSETFIHDPVNLQETNPILFETMEKYFGFNPIETPPVNNYWNGALDPANLSLNDFDPDNFVGIEFYEINSDNHFVITDSPSAEALEAKNILISRLFGMFQNRPDILYKLQNANNGQPVFKIYETDGNIVNNGGEFVVSFSGSEFTITSGALKEVANNPDNNYDLVIWLMGNMLDNLEQQHNGLFSSAGTDDGMLPGWSKTEQETFKALREQERQAISNGTSALGDKTVEEDRAFLIATITTFFERPEEFKNSSSELYSMMSEFFRLDPTETPIYPNI